jgi:peptide/nickel transport system substrate-binding protein
MRIRNTLAILAAAVPLAVAGCAGGNAAVSAGSSEDGTLNWEWQLPTSWDPVTSSAGWDVHVLSLVYSSITGLDKGGNAVGGLASSWKYAPDGKSITFTLRPDLKFSDGTPEDAQAVKDSILRGRDTPNSRIASQLAEVTGVTVNSPTEFVLKLSTVDYQVPNLLAGKTGMVVSPTVFRRDAASLATKPVGDGPFTLASYVPGARADLLRNPNYWDAKDIHLAKFSVQAITDQQQILAALSSGQVNVAVIKGSEAQAAKAAGFTINEIPAETVSTLDIKTSVTPFNNPKVVQALNYAIDRQALVQTQEFGHALPAYQPFPKGYVGYNPSLANLYPHDAAKARQLLADAGHPTGLDITLTTSVAAGTAEQLQAQLGEAGIRVKLDVIPAAQSTQIMYIQKSPALALDGTAGRESPLQMLEVLYDKAGLMNLTAAQTPTVKAAFDKVRNVPLDDKNYAATLRDAVATVVDDPLSAHVWLYSYPRLLATSPQVKGLPYDLVVQRFEGVQVG